MNQKTILVVAPIVFLYVGVEHLGSAMGRGRGRSLTSPELRTHAHTFRTAPDAPRQLHGGWGWAAGLLPCPSFGCKASPLPPWDGHVLTIPTGVHGRWAAGLQALALEDCGRATGSVLQAEEWSCEGGSCGHTRGLARPPRIIDGVTVGILHEEVSARLWKGWTRSEAPDQTRASAPGREERQPTTSCCERETRSQG